MSHQARIGAHRLAVDVALDLDPLPRLHAQREVQRLVDQRGELHGLGRRSEAARLVEEPADDLRHPAHFPLQHRHLRLRRVRQIGAPCQQLEVTAQRVERIAQLVRDGAGELSQRGESLLGGEIAPRGYQQLVELLQVPVLPGQLGGRLLDLPGQLRVEPANLRQHLVEPARQVRQLIAPLRRPGSLHIQVSAFHRAHRELQRRDAADEDAPQQDPEGDDQEQRRSHRDLQQRPAFRRDQALRLGERSQEHQSRLRPAGVVVGCHHPHRAAHVRVVDHLADDLCRRPAPPREHDPAAIDPGGCEVRVDPQGRLPRHFGAQKPAVRPDGRGQLLGDLFVLGPGVLERHGGGAGELRCALADLVLDGTLADAQAQRRSDQERRGEDRGKEKDQLEPERHPAVLLIRFTPEEASSRSPARPRRPAPS